jgi:hypothetical protein
MTMIGLTMICEQAGLSGSEMFLPRKPASTSP